jgi:hypothetical protein
VVNVDYIVNIVVVTNVDHVNHVVVMINVVEYLLAMEEKGNM